MLDSVADVGLSQVTGYLDEVGKMLGNLQPDGAPCAHSRSGGKDLSLVREPHSDRSKYVLRRIVGCGKFSGRLCQDVPSPPELEVQRWSAGTRRLFVQR